MHSLHSIVSSVIRYSAGLVFMLPLPAWSAPSQQGDTLAARLATITTDTGDFAPGHRDFSRYDNPGLCLAAAQVTHAQFQGSIATQELQDTLPAGDTIGIGATMPVARACGQRFRLATTPTPALGALFNLAIYEGDDTLALQALAKGVATHPKLQDELVTTGIQTALQFGRPALAEAILKHAETPAGWPGSSHEPITTGARLQAYFQLRLYSTNTGDTVRARQINEHIATLAAQDTDKGEGYPYVRGAYVYRMREATMMHVDSVTAVARRAQAQLRQYGETDQVRTAFDRYVDWGALPVDSVIDHLAPDWYVSYRQHWGHTRSPQLTADYWFPAPGAAAGDTVFPVRGKVNIICTGGYPMDSWQETFNHHMLGSGYQQTTQLKRWLSMYGSQGLTVAVVRSVREHGGSLFEIGREGRGAWPNDILPVEPAEAAKIWRWYDQTYHQLPVPVAIQTVHVTQWLPQPDGRVRDTSTMQYQRFIDLMTEGYDKGARISPYPGSCGVVDRDGFLIYAGNEGAGAWWNIEHLLTWIFRKPSLGAPKS